jgi:hypothetical protein
VQQQRKSDPAYRGKLNTPEDAAPQRATVLPAPRPGGTIRGGRARES